MRRLPLVSSMLALLVAALAATARAQAPAPGISERRAITVSGHGDASASPDLALLTVAVETEASSAAEAGARNAERADRVLAAVRASLGERGKVATAGYSLDPVYEPPHAEGGQPRVRGYRAHNALRAEIRDLARVGPVIDAALAAGANRVDGLAFQLEGREPARAEALAEAGAAARAAAEAVARALGVRLGEVLAASTVEAQPPMPFRQHAMMAEVAMDRSVPTPIEPGEVTVSADLTVTYAID